MNGGYIFKRALVSLGLVAMVGLVGTGCSAQTDDGDAPAVTGGQVRASASTQDTYGVHVWASKGPAGNAQVQGLDAKGAVRIRFEQTTTADEDGTLHGKITVSTPGHPTFEYVVTPDGTGTVLKNELPDHMDAVDAALAALADVDAAGGSFPKTSGIDTQDLTNGSKSLVSGKAGACMSLIAAACVAAASCGVGGDAAMPVLEATVDAGTSQTCKD